MNWNSLDQFSHRHVQVERQGQDDLGTGYFPITDLIRRSNSTTDTLPVIESGRLKQLVAEVSHGLLDLTAAYTILKNNWKSLKGLKQLRNQGYAFFA